MGFFGEFLGDGETGEGVPVEVGSGVCDRAMPVGESGEVFGLNLGNRRVG